MLKKPLQQLFSLTSMLYSPEAEESAERPSQMGVQSDEVQSAKRMHHDWHHRLVAYLLGRSREDLKPEELCFDDRCEFGRWLQAMGPERLGRQAYNALTRHHQMLHLQASNVVSFHRAGQRDRARVLFKTGYADASRALLATLKSLDATPQEEPVSLRAVPPRVSGREGLSARPSA